MGASTKDIGITIISNGEKAYYSSVKGAGHLMWDIQFGLFNSEKPDPFDILDFTENTDWEDVVKYLDAPLENPIYGTLIVDFDKKEIIDDNGYGRSDIMFFRWFVDAVFKAMSADYNDSLIPKESLAMFLSNSQIKVYNRNYIEEKFLLPSTIEKTYDFLSSLGYQDSNSYVNIEGKDLSWAKLELPSDWKYYQEKKIDNKD